MIAAREWALRGVDDSHRAALIEASVPSDGCVWRLWQTARRAFARDLFRSNTEHARDLRPLQIFPAHQLSLLAAIATDGDLPVARDQRNHFGSAQSARKFKVQAVRDLRRRAPGCEQVDRAR